jgi:hypothetical protein
MRTCTREPGITRHTVRFGDQGGALNRAANGSDDAPSPGAFIVPHPAVRVLAPRTQTAMSGHEVGTY